MSISPWFLASRPKTLPAAIVPVWVGSALPLLDGNPETGSWLLFWCTLLSCLCIQIATNLFNDAIDHHKGADTTKRLGPKRVTASGLLSARAVMMGALGFCALAALVALPLVAAHGWPVIAVGLVSLYFAYGYTGGPFPLAYRGMGEIFVLLFFGFVAVLGSRFMQTGELGGTDVWVLAIQCGFYSCVLISVNNLRDREEDRSTGKKTLAVRFGEKFARFEIAVFCFAPILLWIWWAPDTMSVVIYSCVMIPMASLIVLCIGRTAPGPAYNRFLAMGALQLILFALLVSVTLSR